MALKGVSLAARTKGLCSLIVTSAARRIRFSPYPAWIPATVFMLQGTMSMPAALNDPLAGPAPISVFSST